MPMYDFQCQECETTFPIMCRISERETPKPCPNCQSENTQQVILSAPMMGEAERVSGKKPPAEFRNLLKSIHQRNPGSRMNEYADV